MSPEITAIIRNMCKLFSPESGENVWQWAENNISLTARVTPTPGPYRTTMCPYVRGPQEDFTDPTVETIVLCWASRASKTETALNCIRYSIAKDPQSTMIAMPTSILARSFSESRLQPSIDDCPALASEKPLDSDKYKLLEMHFKRCILYLVGANSPATLKGRGVTVLFCDEIDTWPKASGRETGALEQVLERTKDRHNRKHILTSTPTLEDGQIWGEFKMGDQRYFFVPCPHCREFQTFKLKQIVGFDEAKQPDGTYDMAKLAKVVYYECEHCKGKIQDKHKYDMLEKGEWRATATPTDIRRRSYHLNSIYPVWVKFSDVAAMFLQSKASPEGLQRFVNSWLAEPFYMAGNTAELENKLMALRVSPDLAVEVKEGYRPLITVDVQQDRFYYVVRAHDRHKNSELVDHGVVPGYEELLTVAKRFKTPVGFIDAGFRQQQVLEWAIKHPGWIPTIGSSALILPMRWQDMSIDGGLHKGRMVKSLRFRPDDFKDQLHDRINKRGPTWALSAEVSREYQKNMVGEIRQETKGARGRIKVEWIRLGPNHFFDCEVLQLAGYEAVKSFIFDKVSTVQAPPMPRSPDPAQAVAMERVSSTLWSDRDTLQW